MRNLKVNALLNMVKTCSGILFPLITFPYISHVLMAENIGKINFSATYVNYFSLIASLGIWLYAIRECAKVKNNPEELEEIASQIFSINLITTVVAYVFLGISLIIFTNLATYRELIIIQCTTILFTTLGADWLNTAMEDFAFITVRTIFFQVVSLVLMFSFVKTPDDYLIYAGITVLSSTGANIVNIFYRKKYCHLKFVLKMNWKEHFRPILWMFGMLLTQTIFTSADITMLGIFKGNYTVGIFTTATKIVNIISQVVSSLVFVLIPRLSYMFAGDNYDDINEFLSKILAAFIIIGFPIFLISYLYAPEFIMILAGQDFIPSILLLRIILFSFLFSLVGGSFLGNVVLLSSGKEKLFTNILVITTMFNIVANYIFIPSYGAQAAALSTVASSLLMTILLLLTKDKRIRLNHIKKIFFHPFIGGIGSVLVYLFVGTYIDSIWVKAVLGTIGSGLAYLILISLIGNEFIDGIRRRIINRFTKFK